MELDFVDVDEELICDEEFSIVIQTGNFYSFESFKNHLFVNQVGLLCDRLKNK